MFIIVITITINIVDYMIMFNLTSITFLQFHPLYLRLSERITSRLSGLPVGTGKNTNKEDMLSYWQKTSLGGQNYYPAAPKLIPSLNHEKNYVIHHRNLQSLRMQLKKLCMFLLLLLVLLF